MQTNNQTKRLTLLLAALALLIVSGIALFLATEKQHTPFSPQEAANFRVDVATTFANNRSESTGAMLKELANRQSNPYLKGVVLKVYDRTGAGDPLVEALAKSPEVFNKDFLSKCTQAEHTRNRAEANIILKQIEH